MYDESPLGAQSGDDRNISSENQALWYTLLGTVFSPEAVVTESLILNGFDTAKGRVRSPLI